MQQGWNGPQSLKCLLFGPLQEKKKNCQALAYRIIRLLALSRRGTRRAREVLGQLAFWVSVRLYLPALCFPTLAHTLGGQRSWLFQSGQAPFMISDALDCAPTGRRVISQQSCIFFSLCSPWVLSHGNFLKAKKN